MNREQTVFCVGRSHLFASLCLASILMLTVGIAQAAPPVPANDLQTNPQALSPSVPTIVYATLEGAANDIQDTGLAGIGAGYDDGPDVFYEFTPTTTDVYRFQVIPWQDAPLRSSSSERRFVIYVGTDFDTVPVYIDGLRAPSGGRVVSLDVTLTASTTYHVAVDHDLATKDNCSFTLIVDTLPAVAPDDCNSAGIIPPTLPYAALDDIDGATADFTYDDYGSGRCSVRTATTASGIDHVYEFTPPANGDYAFELISEDFDGVIYIDDSCPPFTLDDCMGASHNAGSGGGKHDLVVATLDSTKTYYIYIDEDDGSSVTGSYTLIVDTAFGYEISEVEPNDDYLTASPIFTPLNGGQILGPTDQDWYGFMGTSGDKFYAYANNGGTSNTGLDLDMGLYASDGVTLIEFDDEDADGAQTPDDYEDLEYIYSTYAPVIAGASLVDGMNYLHVAYQNLALNIVHRYRLHIGIQPGDRNPLIECEPNDELDQADYTGKLFYSGVIATDGDLDVYAFDAIAGDRVFIALDGDPERDATGFDSPTYDPNAFGGKLVVYDPDGDQIYNDISDTNSTQNDLPVPGTPDYPAQAGFFVARVTGTHYVQVQQQSSTQYGPAKTYELAIFLNDAAPALTEAVDPVLVLTPDYPNDEIDVTATDNQVGDTGIGAIDLIGNNNLQIAGTFAPGDPVVNVTLQLVNPAANGTAKLVVTDVAGNTACSVVVIDVSDPVCDGYNYASRDLTSLHDPIHVTDYDLVGVNGSIDVADAGLVTNVTVTVDVLDALDTGDLDIYLVSPTGTSVELVTDRMSSSGIDMRDSTFSDDADEILPILGSAAPYTGTWLPEDPNGLAQLIGEQAQGTWLLNVVDDASSESFGATLVSWSLNIQASFAGPEVFAGTVTDEDGISSIVLSSDVNVQLNLGGFTPGDTEVHYTVTLIDPTVGGSGTIDVTDMQYNTCQSLVSLNGFADGDGPANTGAVTTDLTIKREVQETVISNDPNGVVSTITVPDSFLVGEVEVALMVDADDQGRIAAKLSHGGEFAALINRIGMDQRDGLGNSKPSFDIYLDDDAPQADDIHMEPALGTIATLGLHQTDGRGEFFGDGIETDKRDNMLFTLAGLDSSGDWEILVGDFRPTGTVDNIFRRWALVLKNPCGPERYVGKAVDLGTGIYSIDLAAGSANLAVVANFVACDKVVEYRVELVDPTQAGSGTLEITDCATNVTTVPISLAPQGLDQNLPIVSGSYDPQTMVFSGSASDDQVNDSGIVSVDLAPWSDNLTITSLSGLPAATATFTVELTDPMANGRGYVQVTDACGLRSHVLVEIDGSAPVCGGAISAARRYVSTDTPVDIPNYDSAGVSSSIVITDTDIISDVNIEVNITHPYDDDIDAFLTAPMYIELFTDIGSYGDNFYGTIIDDEAAGPMPDSASSAPFTGSYQPEGGPALYVLDGTSAAGTWTLNIADDGYSYTGTLDSWAVIIESATFPEQFNGYAGDELLYDSGICSVVLDQNGAALELTVDPFTPGDATVTFAVTIAAGHGGGIGTVKVTDCVGNTCEIPVKLGTPYLCGDAEGDGLVDVFDIDAFVFALTHDEAAFEAAYPDSNYWNCDTNCDTDVDVFDIDTFVAAITGTPCNCGY